MPRFAANLDMLFTELPFLDRFDAAAQAGFDGVELLFPYSTRVEDVALALRDAGLSLALINMPVSDWAQGGRGMAAVPGARALFRQDFEQGLDLAQRLGAERLHILEGVASGSDAAATYRANLAWATARAGPQQLTIEVISAAGIPGFYLCNFGEAEAVLRDIGAGNLGLQFDAFHARLITGDALGCWQRYGHLATHIQIADTPDRHEPGTGTANIADFLAEIAQNGYDGWVGAEYHPRGKTDDGLGWLREAK